MLVEAPILLLTSLFIGSFVITYLIMPKIIGVVHYKSLMQNPTKRSSHTKETPSLGGIAFYIVLILGLYFLSLWDKHENLTSFYPGLLILFIIGLKDDLVILSPWTKLIAQLVAISFIVLDSNFYITHLHGFLGLERISLYWSIPLATFIMLMIVNAYNLIDGIDGLASIVGIIIFSVLGVIFYMLQNYFYAGISIMMIGALIAFLRYNLSSDKKIFMGDTGSMIIGFIIGILIIRLLAIGQHELKYLPFQLENLPLVVIAILIVPLFDTTRVFTIRLLNRRDPFIADRNHIHHILIDDLKMSHVQASVLLGIINILFVAVFMILGINFDNLKVLALLILAVLVFVYMFYKVGFLYRKYGVHIFDKSRLKSSSSKVLSKSEVNNK